MLEKNYTICITKKKQDICIPSQISSNWLSQAEIPEIDQIWNEDISELKNS